MQRDISRLTQSSYDLLVVGGGINGAAIAHMAALNGLRVVLLEKNDFASGASSKSTKLIHGGLRYLERLEFGLVREALKERYLLLKDAPHLVKPLSFIIPVYESDRRSLGLVRLGVWLYDFLAGKYLIQRHRPLNVQDVRQLVPGIKAEGLAGGVMYYDAQMDDARLALENVLSADEKGAHVANYVEVESFIRKDGKVVGVRACDRLGGRRFEVYAKKIVCAVGPWTNVLMQKEEGPSVARLPARQGQAGHVPALVRTTKGVHVVCRGQISPHALLIPARQDNRVFFVIPWIGNSLVGTTDTDYKGSPDEVGADERDIDYLLDEAGRVFPPQARSSTSPKSGDLDVAQRTPFNKGNMITVFAGLRPLVREKGESAGVSRRHAFRESPSGVVYCLGGKYTTYRRIAGDCLHVLLPSRQLVDTRESFPLFGSGTISESAEDAARKYGCAPDVVRNLMNFYGTRYKNVLALVVKDPVLKEPLCSCSSFISAQVVYAINTEMACMEEDIIQRRLSLVYQECPTGQCRRKIHSLLTRCNSK
jgi:glycerol-3-phosphate dehydrogenase